MDERQKLNTQEAAAYLGVQPNTLEVWRCKHKSILPLKKAKCEAAAQRRPAQKERKNRFFSAKRQAVWFETQSVSN